MGMTCAVSAPYLLCAGRLCFSGLLFVIDDVNVVVLGVRGVERCHCEIGVRQRGVGEGKARKVNVP